jgi:hypothetical protein
MHFFDRLVEKMPSSDRTILGKMLLKSPCIQSVKGQRFSPVDDVHSELIQSKYEA